MNYKPAIERMIKLIKITEPELPLKVNNTMAKLSGCELFRWLMCYYENQQERFDKKSLDHIEKKYPSIIDHAKWDEVINKNLKS